MSLHTYLYRFDKIHLARYACTALALFALRGIRNAENRRFNATFLRGGEKNEDFLRNQIFRSAGGEVSDPRDRWISLLTQWHH
jgi:hypothetical protein